MSACENHHLSDRLSEFERFESLQCSVFLNSFKSSILYHMVETLNGLVVGVPVNWKRHSILPAERNFAWNPGLMSEGGIPNRSTVCATLSPGDNIQSALYRCPAGQVVQLKEGTYTVNNSLMVRSGITLRGAGAGRTVLVKTNSAPPRTSTVAAGAKGILAPAANAYVVADAQPIVIVGLTRWPSLAYTPKNLTSDGVAGATSVNVANTSGFAAGQLVLLDEVSNATWQSVPPGFPCSGCTVQRGDRTAWNIHNPAQAGDDPQEAKVWFSRFDRPTNEIKEIASVSGDTITFTSPLSIGYRVSAV